MSKRFHGCKKLFWGILVAMGLIVGGLILWQAINRKPLSSSFESVWMKLDGPRLRATKQAAIDFDTVYKVMKHYACKEFEQFFDYKMSILGLSDLEKRGIQRGRDRLLDVDCMTGIRVNGYSEPQLRWARFIGITLLPDKEAEQLARLCDIYGDTISPEEEAIWKRVAFIEVLLGKHELLTVWYHDGTRLWLVSFMGREEVERDLGF